MHGRRVRLDRVRHYVGRFQLFLIGPTVHGRPIDQQQSSDDDAHGFGNTSVTATERRVKWARPMLFTIPGVHGKFNNEKTELFS